MPKIIPPMIAFLNAILVPARIANTPPVRNPPAMGFIKSSLFLRWIKEHSVIENKPPQRAKDPPRTGARFFNKTIPP